MVENELPTVYELHIYELLKTIIGCVRSEHVHDKKDCYFQFSDVGFALRSVTRREVHVPFGKSKKLIHSFNAVHESCTMRCLLGSPLLGTMLEVGTVCTLHAWVAWFPVGVPSRHQVHHTGHVCPLYWKYI